MIILNAIQDELDDHTITEYCHKFQCLCFPFVYNCVGTNYHLNMHELIRKKNKGTLNVNSYLYQEKGKCFLLVELKKKKVMGKLCHHKVPSGTY